MTLIPAVYSGLIAGACGTLGSLICLLALRRHCAAVVRSHAALQSELRSVLREHQADCFARIGQAAEVGPPSGAGRREMALIAKVARIVSE